MGPKTITFLGLAALWALPAAAQWAVVPSSATQTLRAVHFVDANYGWVGGDNGTLLKTTNAGSSWVSQTIPATMQVAALCFHDADTGYAAGGRALLKTTNGGATWTAQNWDPPIADSNFAPTALRDVHCLDNKTVYATGNLSYQGTSRREYRAVLTRTSNGGVTWTGDQGKGVANGHADFLTKDIGYSAGWGPDYANGHTSHVEKTVDGGETWTRVLSFAGSVKLDDITFANPSTGYARSESAVYKTTNAGSTWNVVLETSGPGGMAAIDSTAWVLGDLGRIFKGSGTAWGTQNTGTMADLHAVFTRDGTTAWIVGQSGLILKTTNGGGSVTSIRQRPPVAAKVPSFSLDRRQVRYVLSGPAQVRVSLFDRRGKSLLNSPETAREAGEHTVAAPARLDPGVYFLRLEIGGVPQTARFLLN
jgi:photosystem II stability/assembly factor-like uncharacterized protein